MLCRQVLAFSCIKRAMCCLVSWRDELKSKLITTKYAFYLEFRVKHDQTHDPHLSLHVIGKALLLRYVILFTAATNDSTFHYHLAHKSSNEKKL
ncbi:hypothetical protein E2C01_001204 [Portunus trituberculatus]|uniref:Uncharacterized protein n=1 Tax=Portunus trituberculatus TaxID=210409 RepID=A0A5B7CH89_PORTR|nr:hypothetical protein [Portunus trituberculatus]